MKVYILQEDFDYETSRVLAVFTTKKHAILASGQYDAPTKVIEKEVIDDVPAPQTVYVIDRMHYKGSPDPEIREEKIAFSEEPPYIGKPNRYKRWPYGERVWGYDKDTVQEVWDEAHGDD